jgi:RND family efflux transporter MFP subunit
LVVLVLGGGGAWLLAQGRANGDASPPTAAPLPVPVVRALPRAVRLSVRAHGSVEPAREIELVAEVPGRVARVAVALEPGGFFDAGEVLVELEREDAELALERAESALLRRESEWRLMRARLERLRTLAARAVVSAAQGEEAEYAERSARAGLREARAAREVARRDLARTRIAAPFAGRVREKRVDAGQFVSRGTVLARVHATDAAEVRLPVAVASLADLGLPLAGGEVKAGPKVALRAGLGGRSVTWPARVVRVEGEIAARSRMLHVVARVEDPFGGARPALPPGLFVEAEIEGRRVEGAFALPRTALRPPDEVFVVDAEGRLRLRRVEILRVEDERVLVAGGLVSGEHVCASTLGAMEGMPVRSEQLPERDSAALARLPR